MRKIRLLLLMIFGLLAGQKMIAQTDATDPQVICIGETRPYRVDYLENAGAGTTGSTYTWAVLTPGFLGTIATNQGPGASSNAISINWGATPAGLYVLQVIETNGGCPGTPMTLNIQLTPLITPTFNAIGPLCQNSVAPTLPTSSTNIPAITGTWDAAINTSSVGTVVYTFTPDPGQCATTTTLSVTITNQITPTFTQIGPLCQNSVAPVLPTSSTNIPAITGTWDAAISTASAGTTVYTFTPASGQCAGTATMSIDVNPQVTPTFTQIGPLCQNSVAPVLPTSSNNIPAITGTWNAAISTTSAGTVVYTFTPTAGQCATTTTMSVTVDPQVTPTFTQLGPLCQNSVAPVLPTSSTNIPAITGTWDAVLSTASAGTVVYTFTPTAGQCATTQTMSVVVNPQITPTFTQLGPLCQNSVAPVLPTSSTNIPAITGTWDAVLSTASAGTVVYTFTPTAGQCAITATMSVTVDPLITPTFAAIGPLCQNSVAPTLPTSSTNVPAITGTWNAVLSTASAGTVVYTFTPDPGQCATTATLSVDVNPTPTITIVGGPTCSVDLLTWSVDVTVSAGTLTSTAGTVVNTLGNAWTISGIPAATNITLSSTALGCPGTLAITAPNCNCPTVAQPVGTGAAYCIGSLPVPAITATVLAGQTLNWYDAATGGTLVGTGSPFNPSGPGTYYAEAVDNSTLCVSQRTPVTLTENALPIVSAFGGATLCQGSSTTLSATGAVSYTWNPTTGLSPITGTPVTATPPVGTTVYTVTGTDGNNCQNTDTVTVIVTPTPTTSPIYHD